MERLLGLDDPLYESIFGTPGNTGDVRIHKPTAKFVTAKQETILPNMSTRYATSDSNGPSGDDVPGRAGESPPK
jgi:hypothetical protein